MSFASIMVGVIIYILRNLGFLESSPITELSLKIGLAAQITLLSFASIIQFREMMSETNKKLEELVEKRTDLISTQNKHLRTQNKKIESQFKEIKQSITYAKRIQNAI